MATHNPLRYDARIRTLLASVSKKNNISILSEETVTLNETQERIFQKHKTAVENGYPIEYMLGACGFADMKLAVREPLLIPRPETEWWMTEIAVPIMKKAKIASVADIGTGTGALLLHAVRSVPSIAHAVGIDYSDIALKTAKENWNAHAPEHIAVSWKKNPINSFSHWMQETKRLPGCIISNPPYLTHADNDYQKTHEDAHALYADKNGLAPYIDITNALSKKNWCGHAFFELDPRRVSETYHEIRAAFPAARISVYPDQYDRFRLMHVIS